MKVGAFDARFVGHVCFVFVSPGGAGVVTDPFFSGGFEWKGRVERHLTLPKVAAGDIRGVDAVFVSHVHGDHYDPEAVLTILRNNRANAWAPPEVAEDLVARGLDPARAVALTEGARLKVKDLEAMAFAGYDGSHDAQGRANKFSLLLQAGGTAVFYSGDCHEPPPAMRGRSVDAVFCWPHPDDAKLRGLCQAIPARQFVLMHGDRFEPGDFFCNFDYAKEKARVERLAPGMEVVIPEPIRRLVP